MPAGGHLGKGPEPDSDPGPGTDAEQGRHAGRSPRRRQRASVNHWQASGLVSHWGMCILTLVTSNAAACACRLVSENAIAEVD